MDKDIVQMFFFMRGVRFPSLKYNNTVETLDLDERPLSKCVEEYRRKLEMEENTATALILGPEDCWQFSVLLYIAALSGRCVRNDITRMMNRLDREK
jgi:hypothetical protein